MESVPGIWITTSTIIDSAEPWKGTEVKEVWLVFELFPANFPNPVFISVPKRTNRNELTSTTSTALASGGKTAQQRQGGAATSHITATDYARLTTEQIHNMQD